MDKIIRPRTPATPDYTNLSKYTPGDISSPLSVNQNNTQFYCPGGITPTFTGPTSDPDNLKYLAPKPIAAFEAPDLATMNRINNSSYETPNGEVAQ